MLNGVMDNEWRLVRCVWRDGRSEQSNETKLKKEVWAWLSTRHARYVRRKKN